MLSRCVHIIAVIVFDVRLCVTPQQVWPMEGHAAYVAIEIAVLRIRFRIGVVSFVFWFVFGVAVRTGMMQFLMFSQQLQVPKYFTTTVTLNYRVAAVHLMGNFRNYKLRHCVFYWLAWIFTFEWDSKAFSLAKLTPHFWHTKGRVGSITG